MQETQITTLDELKKEKLVGVQVAGVELIAISCGGQINVYEGTCPHQGTLLSEGEIENGRLTCRGHGWQFHCGSGAKIDDPDTCLHQFSAVVDNGKVLVDKAEIADWASEQVQAGAIEKEQPLLTPEQLPGPPGLPILGNMHQIKVDKIHLLFEKWYRQYGDLYQFKLGNDRAVVIADVEMVQKILQSRPDKFARLRNIRRTIVEMGIQGLFSAEGNQWRRHRQIATRAFDITHLRDFFPVMAAVTKRLHNRWQQLAGQNASFDVQKEMMRYTVDVTTNLAFGYDMNTLEEAEDPIQEKLEHIFPMIARRAFMPVRYWNYLKLPADRALDKAFDELQTSINQFIEHARQQLADDPTLLERPRNLLQALLAAQANENIEFSDLEIYGNVFTFLLAGEDTTANSMAWIMYFMAKYPEVQKRMQAEADAVLKDAALVTEYEKIRQLRYIEAVVHETMRFKPVATFIGFEAISDVTIDKLQIPKGTSVFVLLRPKGLEDSEFENAAEFNPERWLDYSPQDNPHHRKSFSPFGGGPRLCPGRSLALLEIKMALSMICRHFEVMSTNPEQEIDGRFVFTITPEDLMISIRPRRVPSEAI